MKMRIMVVEDNSLQAKELRRTLAEEFPDATLEWIASESSLLDWVQSSASEVPDVIVMDIMLRWAIATENFQDPPPEVVSQGYYAAGLRCTQRVLQTKRVADVPIVLYSVLNNVDLKGKLDALPDHVGFVVKGLTFSPLFSEIRRLLRARGSASSPVPRGA
jgi:CheY-like chemotaxis protein